MLRISDLVTNASQEQKALQEAVTASNLSKRSITEQLNAQASGGSNVTSSDIRQIKLNYLQLNKRQTASNTNMTVGGHQKRESNEALSNNEYAQVEEIVTTGEENISPGNFKSPNS